MTRFRDMKVSSIGLASVGRPRLCGRGPTDGEPQWLETLSQMTRNSSQW